MKFEVYYDPECEKQLEKLPREISVRIVKKFREIAETGKGIDSLKDAEFGFKVRIGDYRALVDLKFSPNQITVRWIDHRSRVYKR